MSAKKFISFLFISFYFISFNILDTAIASRINDDDDNKKKSSVSTDTVIRVGGSLIGGIAPFVSSMVKECALNAAYTIAETAGKGARAGILEQPLDSYFHSDAVRENIADLVQTTVRHKIYSGLENRIDYSATLWNIGLSAAILASWNFTYPSIKDAIGFTGNGVLKIGKAVFRYFGKECTYNNEESLKYWVGGITSGASLAVVAYRFGAKTKIKDLTTAIFIFTLASHFQNEKIKEDLGK